MNLEKRIANIFRMSDEVWQRHAHPGSVWSRTAALPLLVVAVWSRAWWGWWSLVPVAIALFWIWVNPRLFPKPASTNHWASKAVLGERVWSDRDAVPVPQHHRRVPHILNLISALGLPFLIWGLVAFHLWSVLLGVCLVNLGKFWFLDRMVWLYEDMKDATSEYRSWLY
ncbi:DUF6653 family protein [Geitlerinema sp. PCC 9228]|jgi:hypothetical protein|uniref:DUF6653 family protein n=1 Tax=Geitlerinema sp. PCC 9228 TaxID=111611 RepID=UPI0008F9BD1C|nr:DUF6653 family protein [Geitlerinema sp. PCC 9228]